MEASVVAGMDAWEHYGSTSGKWGRKDQYLYFAIAAATGMFERSPIQDMRIVTQNERRYLLKVCFEDAVAEYGVPLLKSGPSVVASPDTTGRRNIGSFLNFDLKEGLNEPKKSSRFYCSISWRNRCFFDFTTARLRICWTSNC